MRQHITEPALAHHRPQHATTPFYTPLPCSSRRLVASAHQPSLLPPLAHVASAAALAWSLSLPFKSKTNRYARSPAARSSTSPEPPSSGGGSHRSLMLRCDVEELEWGSGSHSAFRPLFIDVSRVARFLLSSTFSLSPVGFRQLFAAYNTCSYTFSAELSPPKLDQGPSSCLTYKPYFFS